MASMRSSQRVFPFLAVFFVLCALLLLPGVSAAEDEGSSPAPGWGLLVRGGYYGVPDWILDQLFEQHPEVDGTIVGGELRYYGDGGPSGAFSIGLGFDVGSADGFGTWQENAGDPSINGGGDVDLAAGHITLYFDIVPSSPIHPYIGFGGGAGYAKGRYVREGEEINVEEFVPVIHLPVGVVLNLGENFGLSAEARVIDGISYGGSLQLRF